MNTDQNQTPTISTHKKIFIIVAVLCCLLIAGVLASTIIKQENARAELKKEKADEEYRNSVTSITTVVTAADLTLLDEYPNLRELDVRGSTCYDAIRDYIALHPEVNVIYTFPVDGVEIENTATRLDWQGHSIAALMEAAEVLPQFTEINLGVTDADISKLDALHEAFPDARLCYSVVFNGKEYPCEQTALDLSALSSDMIPEAAELLKKLPAVSRVCLMHGNHSDNDSGLTFEDYEILYTARPDISYDFSFEIFGKTVSVQDTELCYKKVEIGDDGLEEFRKVLPCLPNLTYLSLDRCGTTDEAMAQLRDDFSAVKIVWRVYFGTGFSCMTDTEKIWAIGGLSDDDSSSLKYCTDVRYLDVGHNALTDVSFVAYMPKLEVAILAINPLVDISPLANCIELEYLELTRTQVDDISVLANCTKLKHLELSQCYHIDDISPVFGLDLERFYMINAYNEDLDEQYETFKELHPDCDANFTNTWNQSPYYVGNWRYTNGVFSERYALLREQLGYDDPFGATKLYWYLDRDDNSN